MGEFREAWTEVGRRIEEFGDAVRSHLSPDAARSPSDPVPDPAARPAAEDAPADAGQGTADRAGPTGGTGGPSGGGTNWGTGFGWAGAAGGGTPWGETASGDTASGGTSSGGTARGGTASGGTAGGADDPWAAATADGGTRHAGTDRGRRSGPRSGWTGGRGGWAGSRGGAADGWASGRSGWGAARGGRAGSSRGADWDAARDSMRQVGESARRLYSQAGDAVRDPEVRESATRAARTLSDAIVSTVEGFTADLQRQMRNPRWSDPSRPRPTERPPVAPVDDDEDPPR